MRGPDLEEVTRAVHSLDGRITHELGIIGAVGAELTAAQAGTLAELSGFRVASDQPLGIDRNGRTERNG